MLVPPVSAVAGSSAVASVQRSGNACPAATETALPAFAALLAGETPAVPPPAAGGENLPPAATALPVGGDVTEPERDVADADDVPGDVLATALPPVVDQGPVAPPALAAAVPEMMAGPSSDRRDAVSPPLDRPATDQSPSADGAIDDGEADDIESLMRRVQLSGRQSLPGGGLGALGLHLTRPVLPLAKQDVQAVTAANGNGPGAVPAAGAAGAGPSPALAADAAKAVTEMAAALSEPAPRSGMPDEGGETAAAELASRPPAPPPVIAPGRNAPAASQGLPSGLAPGTHAWGQAVGERLLVMSGKGVQVAELRLDPPELGSLHIRLQVQQDQVSLNISSPHAQVREALEQQMPRLREMLAEQGLSLGNSTVAGDSGQQGRQAGEAQVAEFGAIAPDLDDVEPAASPALTASPLGLVDQYV